MCAELDVCENAASQLPHRAPGHQQDGRDLQGVLGPSQAPGQKTPHPPRTLSPEMRAHRHSVIVCVQERKGVSGVVYFYGKLPLFSVQLEATPHTAPV